MKTNENRRLHVAILIPGGIGTGKNNIGVPVMERIVKLLSREFDVTVFSLFKVNVHYNPQGFELIDVSHSVKILAFVRAFTHFRRQHRVKRFRVVHGFWALPSGLFAVLVGRIFGIKSIVSILGGDAIALPEINYGQQRRPLTKRLILWTLQKADTVIVLTNYLLKNLNHFGLSREDIKIIPWGIDTTLFVFREKALDVAIKFLHVANLHPVKDQNTLLRTFKLISDDLPAQLTIIGEGVMEQQVKELTESLNLTAKVIFRKPVPYEELASIYHEADILLHTSLSEGQSEVVTEAMSSGLVVCGTKVGLLYDIPECCVSVPVGDSQALALETLKVLRDPVYFNKLRKNAHEWARTHSIFWTVDRIKECYVSEI